MLLLDEISPVPKRLMRGLPSRRARVCNEIELVDCCGYCVAAR